MNRIEQLINNYRQEVSLPWSSLTAGAERIWFCVYNKMDERRLRPRITEFEIVTKQAKHGWKHIDLTDSFALWMSNEDYKDEYFENPEDLKPVLDDYKQEIVGQIKEYLQGVTEKDVVAISGIASLYGFIKMSELIKIIKDDIKGRLAVFFPGEYDGNNCYRMLDARDGWNYLATPITCHERAI